MQTIMKVVICDSSVSIGLADDPLVETALRWKVKLAVPDVLYERELRAVDGERLRRLGLRVEALMAADFGRALDLRKLYPPLSFTDSCVLALAAAHAWLLLTRNPTLARIAAENAVEFRDLAWLRAETMRLETLPLRALAARRNPSIGEFRLHYETSEHSSV